MSSHIQFTQDVVREVQPAAKPTYYYDTQERGLTLVISPKGKKTFYFTGRINGRSDRIPAGRFPETSLERAKKNVLAIRTAIVEGRDPRQAVTVARRQRSAANTLAQFWEIYLADHAKKNRARWREDQRSFNYDLTSGGTFTSEVPGAEHNTSFEFLKFLSENADVIAAALEAGEASPIGKELYATDGVTIAFNKWVINLDGLPPVIYWEGKPVTHHQEVRKQPSP